MHLTWRLGYRETREPALQPRFRYGWARYGCSTVGRNAPRLAARLSRNAIYIKKKQQLSSKLELLFLFVM